MHTLTIFLGKGAVKIERSGSEYISLSVRYDDFSAPEGVQLTKIDAMKLGEYLLTMARV